MEHFKIDRLQKMCFEKDAFKIQKDMLFSKLPFMQYKKTLYTEYCLFFKILKITNTKTKF